MTVNVLDYWNNHQTAMSLALTTVNEGSYVAFESLVHICATSKVPIVVMGNGGSAALANHLACDWMKGVPNGPFVHSLVSNVPLITAIGNDLGYKQIFSHQIMRLPYEKAFVIAISSSGSSPNIVEGLYAAADRNYLCGALVGFGGGTVVKEQLAAGMTLHVRSHDYGIIEDSHSVIMHAIANTLRSNIIP